MSIGKITSKAAGYAVDTVGELLASSDYPESRYALAMILFKVIERAERNESDETDLKARDRRYYLQLMTDCLDVCK